MRPESRSCRGGLASREKEGNLRFRGLLEQQKGAQGLWPGAPVKPIELPITPLVGVGQAIMPAQAILVKERPGESHT